MNILTVDGASPLFIAAQEGLVDCMNTLLAAGDFFYLFFPIVIPVISNSPFQIYSSQSEDNLHHSWLPRNRQTKTKLQLTSFSITSHVGVFFSFQATL